MSDTPGLYWCYGSDAWKQWELGDVFCGSTNGVGQILGFAHLFAEKLCFSGRSIKLIAAMPPFLLLGKAAA